MLDDFQFDDFDEEDGGSGGDEFGPPEGSGNNRTFLYVAGGLGVIIVIGMIMVAVWGALKSDDGDTADTSGIETQAAQSAINETQNAELSAGATQLAEEASWTATPADTATPTETPVPATATVTETPLAGAVTSTPGADASPTGDGKGGGAAEPTTDPRTATVEALLTQASVAQTQAAATLAVLPTSTPVTALPDTGFIDDFGAVGLAGLAALLIVIIFAARRMRDDIA